MGENCNCCGNEEIKYTIDEVKHIAELIFDITDFTDDEAKIVLDAIDNGCQEMEDKIYEVFEKR